jgi:RimJ/RimL family protein N-acetyltransferase
MSEESELENQEGIENWPGYDYPLACRIIKSTDAPLLYPVMKKSAKHLRGYVNWAKYSPSWDIDDVQKFVRDHVESEWPRFHLIFTIGYEIVAFGSLAPVNRDRSVQIALWTSVDHTKRGIGAWVVQVLEWYAFYVFGYDTVYYQFDSSNKKSGSLPKQLGYTFSHTFNDEIHASKETGFWFSFKKQKPDDIPPGAIDTGTLSNWDGITFPWKCLI